MAGASKILESLPSHLEGKQISVRDVLEEMDGRSLFLTLLFLTAPNLIPFVNTLGITHVTGVLLLLYISQMIAGIKTPWLPQKILQIKTSKAQIEKISSKIAPYLEKLEKVVRPRAQRFATGKIIPVYGLMLLMLTIVLLFPIPFFNVVPASFMTVIIAGLLQKDGIVAVTGFLTGLLFLGGLCYGLMMFHSEFLKN